MRALLAAIAFLLLLLSPNAHAARIGDLVESGVWEQATRFLSLQDPAVRLALLGSVLLGVTCGLLGAFLVVRRLSLVGDVLSHAVLPGVTTGFLWNMNKDPVAIFIGATLAGLAGTFVVNWITRTTKLKEDTAMALVLAVFFAIGLVMMGIIQRLPDAGKSGLDKALFGQAAALSTRDIQFMAGVGAAALLFIGMLYKELLVVSFDAAFARTVGIRAAWIHHAFMFLLSAAVVVALQAVGVVLVSAMLITPAATAYLLTQRLHRMLLLSALFGMLAGVLGAFVSFLRSNLPTGPCMVIAAAFFFAGALLFSPIHGVVPSWLRRVRRRRRAREENTLKAIYLAVEASPDSNAAIPLTDLAAQRRVTLAEALHEAESLVNPGLVVFEPDRTALRLSTEGTRRAAAIVRNHRLWELYLTETANYRPDHVHDDAEEIEHVLDDDLIKLLERRLGYPERDPHGRAIPRPQ